jgi:D-galactarolactone cycloisomerase
LELSLAQPDIAACGGISEFSKICTLASTFGVSVIPHVWGSAVGLAAGLHAVATLPPSPYTANPIYLENEVRINC